MALALPASVSLFDDSATSNQTLAGHQTHHTTNIKTMICI